MMITACCKGPQAASCNITHDYCRLLIDDVEQCQCLVPELIIWHVCEIQFQGRGKNSYSQSVYKTVMSPLPTLDRNFLYLQSPHCQAVDHRQLGFSLDPLGITEKKENCLITVLASE